MFLLPATRYPVCEKWTFALGHPRALQQLSVQISRFDVVTPIWHTQYGAYDPEYLGSHYSSIEPGTGRRYTLSDVTNPNKDRPNLTYEWQGITKVWRWTKDRMQRAHDEGRLVYTKSGAPRYKRYLDEMRGTPVTTIWDDIPFINSQAQERLDYPTQKPLALLERIINASSNPGDVVLDPFCGCGTAVAAAQKLGRQWIGIDITHLSIALQKSRLQDMFSLKPKVDYQVIGEPEDLGAAHQLASDDRYQFQWWALSLVRARPLGGEAGSKTGKKGAGKGIDGVITFIDDATNKPKQVLNASRVLLRQEAAIPTVHPLRVERTNANRGLPQVYCGSI